MKYLVSIFIMFLSTLFTFAQNDTTNQMDHNGMRTGYWLKHYPNGQIQYEGYFSENLPIGTLTRYYENGQIKATLTGKPKQQLVDAKIFDKDGIRRASGFYLNQRKDGLWSFYTDKNELLLTITYKQDKLHGLISKYYANGNLMENTNWINNHLQGLQILYNELGKKKAEIHYFADKMHGLYKVFNDEGLLEITGLYSAGLKEGKWQYFKESGSIDYELIYKDGVLLNPEIMDKKQRESFKLYEKNRLILKDPMLYLNDPIEYFTK